MQGKSLAPVRATRNPLSEGPTRVGRAGLDRLGDQRFSTPMKASRPRAAWTTSSQDAQFAGRRKFVVSEAAVRHADHHAAACPRAHSTTGTPDLDR
jgi:hypothetical protein